MCEHPCTACVCPVALVRELNLMWTQVMSFLMMRCQLSPWWGMELELERPESETSVSQGLPSAQWLDCPLWAGSSPALLEQRSWDWCELALLSLGASLPSRSPGTLALVWSCSTGASGGSWYGLGCGLWPSGPALRPGLLWLLGLCEHQQWLLLSCSDASLGVSHLCASGLCDVSPWPWHCKPQCGATQWNQQGWSIHWAQAGTCTRTTVRS